MEKTVIWTNDEEKAGPLAEVLANFEFEVSTAKTLVQVLSHVAPVPPVLAFIERDVFNQHSKDFGMIKTSIPPGNVMPFIWYGDTPRCRHAVS